MDILTYTMILPMVVILSIVAFYLVAGIIGLIIGLIDLWNYMMITHRNDKENGDVPYER